MFLAYVRSFLATIVYPFFVVIISTLFIVQNILLSSRRIDNAFLMIWGKISCRMFGVHVRFYGAENLPKSGCIYLFNHSSFFDIFAMCATISGLRFGAKIELFKIPFFGMAMKRIGVLPIDRQKRDHVYQIYEDSIRRIQAGEQIALSPEGGRQDQDVLGSFKAGPFVFAINAQAPLCPVIIRGAHEVLSKSELIPNKNQWTREITVEVLPMIKTTGYQLENRVELQGKTYEVMREALQTPGPV